MIHTFYECDWFNLHEQGLYMADDELDVGAEEGKKGGKKKLIIIIVVHIFLFARIIMPKIPGVIFF